MKCSRRSGWNRRRRPAGSQRYGSFKSRPSLLPLTGSDVQTTSRSVNLSAAALNKLRLQHFLASVFEAAQEQLESHQPPESWSAGPGAMTFHLFSLHKRAPACPPHMAPPPLPTPTFHGHRFLVNCRLRGSDFVSEFSTA